MSPPTRIFSRPLRIIFHPHENSFSSHETASPFLSEFFLITLEEHVVYLQTETENFTAMNMKNGFWLALFNAVKRQMGNNALQTGSNDYNTYENEDPIDDDKSRASYYAIDDEDDNDDYDRDQDEGYDDDNDYGGEYGNSSDDDDNREGYDDGEDDDDLNDGNEYSDLL